MGAFIKEGQSSWLWPPILLCLPQPNFTFLFFICWLINSIQEPRHLQLLADLEDNNIFTVITGKKLHNAPTDFEFCIKVSFKSSSFQRSSLSKWGINWRIIGLFIPTHVVFNGGCPWYSRNLIWLEIRGLPRPIIFLLRFTANTLVLSLWQHLWKLAVSGWRLGYHHFESYWLLFSSVLNSEIVASVEMKLKLM